jgi:XTP/dITP diphosphohydrolase
MRAVRERCVWSQRITHDDLVPYLVEESAELVDAVETGTRADLREELGDLLWQVLFHAAVAAEDPTTRSRSTTWPQDSSRRW